MKLKITSIDEYKSNVTTDKTLWSVFMVMLTRELGRDDNTNTPRRMHYLYHLAFHCCPYYQHVELNHFNSLYPDYFLSGLSQAKTDYDNGILE